MGGNVVTLSIPGEVEFAGGYSRLKLYLPNGIEMIR